MYPHERSLVTELKDEPFALIGVNSDKNLEKIRATIKKKGINWRSFQNAPKGTEASISKAWAVRGWPTLVVMDHNMRVHYRGHNGDEAITKVRTLLKNMQ